KYLHAPLRAKSPDDFDFFLRENFAGGVVRRIENEGARFVGECCFQFFLDKMPVGGMQRDIPGRSTGENRVRSVVFVEGLEYDYLVAGINESQHGGNHPF